MSKATGRWKWVDLLILAVAAVPILLAIGFYDRLPESLAVHFNLRGEADGYQGKLSFLLTYGLLMTVMPWLMKLLPAIDPKRENYAKFNDIYELFRLLITLVLSGLLGIVIAYNLGYQVRIQMIVLLIIGGLWIIIGNYLGRIRFNYFVGIRTPWTLANEEVWRRTHRLAGPLWMEAGLIAILAAFLPGIVAVWGLGIALGLSVVIPTVFSYLFYRQQMRS